MRALHSMRRTTSAAAMMAAAGVVLLAGCSPRELSEARAQTLPVAVNCEPTQRAIVRPVVINGATMSQVDCVSADLAAAPITAAYQPGVPSAVPVSYASAFARPQTVSFEDARVAPAPATSTVAPRRVTYQRAPQHVVRRQTRSVAKSALIIGSSAGAGAGLGALIGGKKGALIGAAAAGGGATLWDQLTRRVQQ